MTKFDEKLKMVTKPIDRVVKYATKHSIYQIHICNITDIFKHADIYMQYYLLTKNTNTHLTITTTETSLITALLSKMKHILSVPNSNINLDKDILKFVKLHIKNFISYNDIFRILTYVSLTKEDLIFFRKFFGYNLIYKEYKKQISTDFATDSIKESLYVILQLLDNNTVCYNGLLEIYKQLNYYLQNKVLDKNFLHCCTVLYTLLRYDTRLPNDDIKDAISGVCVYLYECITKHFTYTIYNTKEIQVLVELISLVYTQADFKFKRGFCIRCISNIFDFFTGMYEDSIILSFLLQLLDCTIDNCICSAEQYRHECEPTYHEPCHGIDEILDKHKLLLLRDKLLSFNFVRNEYSECEYSIHRYLKYKYNVLDKINKRLNLDCDKISLYNDLYNNPGHNRIVLESISTDLDFIIDDLIVLVNASSNKMQYIDILFKACGTTNLSYLYLYFLSLKNNHKDVLYFVLYYTKIDISENKKYIELLLLIYIQYIEYEDVYINKARMYIIKRLVKELSTDMLHTIMRELKKYTGHNRNMTTLIFAITKHAQSIDEHVFTYLFDYLMCELSHLANTHRRKLQGTKTPCNVKCKSSEYLEDNTSNEARVSENKDKFENALKHAAESTISSGCVSDNHEDDLESSLDNHTHCTSTKKNKFYDENKDMPSEINQSYGIEKLSIHKTHIYKNSFTFQKYSGTMTSEHLYVSNCVMLLDKLHDIHILTKLKTVNYYTIIVALMYHIINNHKLDTMKDEIIDFVLVCRKKERREVYKLIELCKKINNLSFENENRDLSIFDIVNETVHGQHSGYSKYMQSYFEYASM